jgi:hypothetical protein
MVYLQSVPAPAFRGTSNSDLLYYVLDLRRAIDLANSDKAALRRWAEGLDGK